MTRTDLDSKFALVIVRCRLQSSYTHGDRSTLPRDGNYAPRSTRSPSNGATYSGRPGVDCRGVVSLTHGPTETMHGRQARSTRDHRGGESSRNLTWVARASTRRPVNAQPDTRGPRRRAKLSRTSRRIDRTLHPDTPWLLVTRNRPRSSSPAGRHAARAGCPVGSASTPRWCPTCSVSSNRSRRKRIEHATRVGWKPEQVGYLMVHSYRRRFLHVILADRDLDTGFPSPV